MLVDTRGSLFWKVIEYSFYFFFITFPFINYSSFLYSGTSTRSLNLIIFAALLGIGLSIWLFTKEASMSIVKSPLFIALTVYLLSLTVSGLSGLNFSTTFWSVATRMTGMWYFLALGLFMLMLWAVISHEKRHHTLIRCIIFSTALYSILDLVGRDGFGWFFKNSSVEALTFGNTTFAAMYIFAAFLLALYYLLQAEHRNWWMYTLPIAIIINPNIISPRIWVGNFSEGIIGAAQASSFAVFLSLCALLGIWLVSKIKDTQQQSVVSYSLFGLGLLVALLTSFSLLSPDGYLREAYLSRSSAARPLVWEMSEKAIGQRPYVGWGADNFDRVFEKNYDNRLLQDEYGNEAWFDRAHNVFIDQMVDNGVVGLVLYLLVYIVTILALIYTALNAATKRDRVFASILIVYFTLHIAELQTAFDTSISYPILGCMFVSAAVLYHRARSLKQGNLALTISPALRYTLAGVLLAFFSWSLLFGALPLTKAQIANGGIRAVGSAEKRIPLYPDLFGSPIDEQAFLWRTVTDFERGISQDPTVLNDPKKVEGLEKEIIIFENRYREYVKANPTNFRAHLNLADVLIYQRLFGVDKLKEAQEVLDTSIELVPQSPQPYWMKAVGYIYMRKFDLARTYAKKGLELNPKIVQSQEVVKYVEDSIKTFPDIDLFFFRQI